MTTSIAPVDLLHVEHDEVIPEEDFSVDDISENNYSVKSSPPPSPLTTASAPNTSALTSDLTVPAQYTPSGNKKFNPTKNRSRDAIRNREVASQCHRASVGLTKKVLGLPDTFNELQEHYYQYGFLDNADWSSFLWVCKKCIFDQRNRYKQQRQTNNKSPGDDNNTQI